MKKFALIFPVSMVAVVFALSGCSDDENGVGDAPVSSYRDDSPAQIINFPDGAANWAIKCDHHGNMLYSNFRDGFGFIVPNKDCPNDWPAVSTK